MKKISKFINIFLSVVLILVALGVAYVAFPQFGNQALIVRSGSMSPNIPVGAIVVARPTETYRVGDVLTFRSEKSDKTMITHRITEIGSDDQGLFYKTKGDANEEADGWLVRPSKILGKVNFSLPYAGQFLTFVKSDIGFFAMIVIPAVFVMMLETWNIMVEIRKRRKISQVNKPFEGFGFNEASIISSKNKWLGLKIFIPFLLILTLTVPGTYALLTDEEKSVGNIFQAAEDFSITPTPEIDEVPLQVQTFSVEPTQTLDINQPALQVTEEPTPSPSVSPVPTESPSLTPEITVEPTVTPATEL